MNEIFIELFHGSILAILYFETTKTNDTTFQNFFTFLAYYLIMVFCGKLTNTNTSVITNAFITKTIFTLVDERIKSKKEDKMKLNNEYTT